MEPDYQRILDELRRSERVAADETGWRIGGHPAWLHAWVGDRATAPTCSAAPGSCGGVPRAGLSGSRGR
ncbi:: DDE_Tnp_IS66 [Gemmata massiliana]|uniref:: DDE_Tnp_IS66 n=1 Tax=Gemmata massiliana TaxID=1210884 RepID=A0A6P2DDC4_9BACT|nr:: DDE_Tnp_IS66 [Gemmata massiliana]